MIKPHTDRKKGGRKFPFLALFLLVFFLGSAVVAFKMLPFFQARQFTKLSRYTLVLNQDPLTVISFDWKDTKAFIFSIPDTVHVNAAFGYGLLPIQSVYKTGQLDRRGKEVLSLTLQNVLGVPISAVATQTRPLPVAIDKSSRLQLLRLLADKDLNPLDTAAFLWHWLKLRSDKIVVFKLDRVSAFEEVILPDGRKVQTFDFDKLDRILADAVSSSTIREVQMRLGIVNTTDVDGLGAKVGRLISLSGGNVISVQSAPEKIATCRFDYSADKFAASYTVRFLQNAFTCDVQKIVVLDSRFDGVFYLGSRIGEQFKN